MNIEIKLIHQGVFCMKNLLQSVRCVIHYLTTNHFLLKMNLNHTQLLTLANHSLTNLFKNNLSDKLFSQEFVCEIDNIVKNWQIDDNHINPTIYSKPMILVQCQLIYEKMMIGNHRLYFDKIIK